VTELLPHERGVVLVIGAVQEDHVKVRVEPEVRRAALHNRHRARLRAERAAGRRTLHVERVHALDEDAGEGRKQRAVVRKPAPPRERERHHPLAERGLREHPLDEVGCGGAHASTEARRAESAAFAAKRDESALVARAAPKPREAAAEQAAVEVRFELLRRVLWQLDVERAVGDGAVERLEVVAHELVERRGLWAVTLVVGGAAVVEGSGR